MKKVLEMFLAMCLIFNVMPVSIVNAIDIMGPSTVTIDANVDNEYVVVNSESSATVTMTMQIRPDNAKVTQFSFTLAATGAKKGGIGINNYVSDGVEASDVTFSNPTLLNTDTLVYNAETNPEGIFETFEYNESTKTFNASVVEGKTLTESKDILQISVTISNQEIDKLWLGASAFDTNTGMKFKEGSTITVTHGASLEGETLDDVAITGLTTPVTGERPNNQITCSEHASVSLKWYDGVLGFIEFEKGKTYKAEITVTPDEGYLLGTNISVNGEIEGWTVVGGENGKKTLTKNFLVGSDTTGSTEKAPNSLKISGSNSVTVGGLINGSYSETLQLTATGTYDDGTKTETDGVSWYFVSFLNDSQETPKGATINNNGLVTVTTDLAESFLYVRAEKCGVKSEKFKITIRNDGGSSGGDIVEGLVSLSIIGDESITVIGDNTAKLQLKVTGTYDNGITKNETSGVAWNFIGLLDAPESVDGATIDGNGLITVTNEFSDHDLYVQAKKGGKTATHRIIVRKDTIRLNSVEILGDSSIAIPEKGKENSLNFDIKCKDQFGDDFSLSSETVIWKITSPTSPKGVEINIITGSLSVDSSASETEVVVEVAIAAKEGKTITNTKTITITKDDSIVSRIGVKLDEDSVDVPKLEGTFATIKASAIVYDQYGYGMDNQTVEWSLKQNLTDVTIDDKGLISVGNLADDGTVSIIASIGDIEGSAQLKINKDQVLVTNVIIEKDSDTITAPISNNEVEKTYTAKIVNNYGVEEEYDGRWVAENVPSGVTVENNKVIVSSNATAGTFSLTAKYSDTIEDTIMITIVKKELANITGLKDSTLTYGTTYTPSAVVDQIGDIEYTYIKDNKIVQEVKKVGIYTVKATFETDTHSGEATATVIVNPKPITISGVIASSRVYDGTAVVNLEGGTLQGVAFGEDVPFILGTGSTLDKNAGYEKSVVTNISLTGEKAQNYELTQPSNIVVDILKKNLELTAPTTNPTKIYDSSTTCDDIIIKASGLVSGESGDVVVEAVYQDKNAGVDKVLTLGNESISGLKLSNYSYNLPIVKGDITAMPVSVNIVGETKVEYGKSFNHAASASLLDTDTASFHVLYNNKGEKPTDAGNYTLNASIDNDNYSISSITGVNSFEIMKTSPVVTAVMQNITYDDNELKIVSSADFGIAIPGSWSIQSLSDEVNPLIDSIVGGDKIEYQLASGNTVSDIGKTAIVNVTFNPDDSTNYESVNTTLSITLIAKNTVTFNSNGGNSVASQNIEDGSYASAPTAPTKNKTAQFSYSFDGWYTSLDNGVTLNEKFDFVNTPITDDITLYAKWISTTNQYTVTFEDYDGKELDKQTIDYGTGAIISTSPTRVGYTFTGWDKNFEYVVSDITVTAKYEIKEYTVTFIAETNEVSSTDNKYTVEDTLVVNPTVPSREGYTGVWENYAIDILNPKDITVNAQYSVNTYNVVFNSNGATSGSMMNQEFIYDETQNLTSNSFVKLGYTFEGWALSSSAEQVEYENNASIKNLTSTNNETVNLYAIWIPNTNTAYSVKHYQQNLLDDDYTLVDKENSKGTTDTNVTPVVKSYTGFIAPAEKEVTISGDGSAIVEYKYDRKTYDVIFDENTGSIATDYKDVKYGTMIDVPNTVKTGYTLVGWTTTIGNVNIPTGTTALTVSENATYTGAWNVITYTITYNGVDGAKFEKANPLTYNIEDEFKLANPTKDKAIFNGWSKDNATGEMDVTISKSYGNQTYTATWLDDLNSNQIDDSKEPKYSVTYSDGVDGANIFDDQTTENILFDTLTPKFIGVPTRNGFTFKGWDKEIAETVKEEIVYVALWEKITNTSIRSPWYDIYVTKSGEGYVTPECGDDSIESVCEYCDGVFTFIPAYGYRIDAVWVDGINMGTLYSYTFEDVLANHTLHIDFVKGTQIHENPNTGVMILEE